MNLDHPGYRAHAIAQQQAKAWANAIDSAIDSANAQARATATQILNAPIPANHAVTVYLRGKAEVFEAALQAVRRETRVRGPLPPELVWIADQAARAVRWLG